MEEIMKHGFILFSIAFTVGIVLQSVFQIQSLLEQYAFWVVSVTLLVYVLLVFKKRYNDLFYILTMGILIGILYISIYTSLYVKPIVGLADQSTFIEAQIIDYPQIYEDSQRVTLKIECRSIGLNIPTRAFKTLAYLPLTKERLKPGDKIKGLFTFYKPSIYDGFQRDRYYEAQNYFILASYKKTEDGTAENISILVSPDEPVRFKPLTWGQSMKTRLSNFLGERQSGFMKALLFGDKSELNIADRQNMQKAGLSHVMAVSGLHIGFLVAFFLLTFGRRIGTGVAVLAVLFFIPMAGASPSVIRAAIMYLFIAISFYFRWENKSLYSLAAALLILLLQNPYVIQSVSLQLSFLASLGLILFSSKCQAILMGPFRKIKNKHVVKLIALLMSTVSCSLCASFLTTPVLFCTFGYISVFSVVGNVFTIGVFALTFILGLLLCAAYQWGFLTYYICSALNMLCNYIFSISTSIGNLHYGLLYWESWYTKATIILVYIIVILALLFPRKLKFVFTAPLICMFLIFAVFIGANEQQHERRVTLLPSGSGQAIAVSMGHQKLAVIDCGASGHRNAAQNVLQYMNWNGYEKIDLLVLTAVDKTHARNVRELLESVSVEKIIIPSDLKESDILSAITQYASDNQIAMNVWDKKGECLVDDMLGLSLIGGMERKLIARISIGDQGDLLVLHSLTQKMLDSMLTEQPLHAKRIVLSSNNLQNKELLKKSLETLKPEEIYVQTGYETVAKLYEIPVKNTLESGEILLKARCT